ncbi:HD domain-containing protein [Nonomuraea indica]|uniref:HD domain-containing protein n=1 Tax=Nonomuraea indica TaxID=1581193 RepID=UPI000C7E7193|nr:metal-dependent phosphohydrolase [Nonomuraea indica]
MQTRWLAVAGRSPAAAALGAELVARWSEPHRRYHTITHLAAVLDAVDELYAGAPRPSDTSGPTGDARGTGGPTGDARGTGGPTGDDPGVDQQPAGGGMGDPVAVRLAAWFHDAVYDGRPGWDEERSAWLALARLPRCGVPAARVAEVARLVRLTAAHDRVAADDLDGAVLCDADLAVLGRDGYGDYAARVREEYAHVPEDLFRQGRAEVLRRLLATPRLYRTARAYELWEARARANMSAELTALTTSAPHPAG